MQAKIGIVVIGRNEGERLRQCLKSLGHHQGADTTSSQSVIATTVVYVDSGSSDGSMSLATAMGAQTLDLDTTIPFTAARARNEGFALLRKKLPSVAYVQFMDGDCMLCEGWLEQAVSFLDRHVEYAVACGRIREKYPEASVYNLLCDIEWNTPIGDAAACGGNALMRADAFQSVNGYNPEVIAGEEPELCVRLRQQGWKIHRLDVDMALHDAAMVHFEQWWKRAVRAGFAYALGSSLHGDPPEKHWVHETRSIWIWGVAIPTLSILLAWWTYGLSLLLLAAYFVPGYRCYRYMRSRDFDHRISILYSASCVLAKFPQAQGVLKFCWNKLMATRSPIIEYKRS